MNRKTIERLRAEHCERRNAEIAASGRDDLLPPMNPDCIDFFASPLIGTMPETVYVLGSGPNGREHWGRIPDDAYVISVNQAVLIRPSNLWVTFDRTLWHEPKPWWEDALKVKVTRLFGDVNAGRVWCEYSFRYAPHFHEPPKNQLLHGVLRGGCNVAGCACQAAYYGGAKRLIMCGIDMFGQQYFDGSTNDKVRPHEWKWTSHFSALLDLIRQRGVEVLSLSKTQLAVKVI